jgi:hypothetical protein
MLIEIWEKLRGYDKWIAADARVVSYETLRKVLGKRVQSIRQGHFACDLLLWEDQRGEYHFGPFVNHEGSRLFQLLDNETVTIRYDPSTPDRYYNREYFLGRLAILLKGIAGLTVFVGFLTWIIWMIVTRRAYGS